MKVHKGDTVRLASSAMLAEFGLVLCDDAEELLMINGVIQEVMNDMARLVIKRMMPRTAPFAWEEGYTNRLVRE